MARGNTGKRFLVVGATGNVGSLVAAGLLKRGESVRCLIRSPEKAEALQTSGAETVIGDLDQFDTLKPAFAGIDSVFFVTAINPNTEQQTRNGIGAAVAAGVGHFVRYSTIKIPSAPQLRSARMHEAIEGVLDESGLNYSYIRPSHYMQNLLHSAPMIQSESKIYGSYGDGRIGLMDLRDMAEASVKVLTTEGHLGNSYSITGPRAITFTEAAEAISRAIGRTVSYVDLPPESQRATLQSVGMDEWLVDEFLAYFDVFRDSLADVVTDDFEKLMGRPPRSIDDFARGYATVFDPSLVKSPAT